MVRIKSAEAIVAEELNSKQSSCTGSTKHKHWQSDPRHWGGGQGSLQLDAIETQMGEEALGCSEKHEHFGSRRAISLTLLAFCDWSD